MTKAVTIIDINVAMHAQLVPTAAFTCVHDAQSVIDAWTKVITVTVVTVHSRNRIFRTQTHTIITAPYFFPMALTDRPTLATALIIIPLFAEIAWLSLETFTLTCVWIPLLTDATFLYISAHTLAFITVPALSAIVARVIGNTLTFIIAVKLIAGRTRTCGIDYLHVQCIRI